MYTNLVLAVPHHLDLSDMIIAGHSRFHLSEIGLLGLVHNGSLGRRGDIFPYVVSIEEGRDLLEWQLMTVFALGLDHSEVEVGEPSLSQHCVFSWSKGIKTHSNASQMV